MENKQISRDLVPNFPSVDEVKDDCVCISCHVFPSHPVLTCTKGHLLCLEHADSNPTDWEACPVVLQHKKPNDKSGKNVCGGGFVRLKMKWYETLCSNTEFRCPYARAGCDEVMIGIEDAKQHSRKCYFSQEKESEEIDHRQIDHDEVRPGTSVPDIPAIQSQVVKEEVEVRPKKWKNTAVKILIGEEDEIDPCTLRQLATREPLQNEEEATVIQIRRKEEEATECQVQTEMEGEECEIRCRDDEVSEQLDRQRKFDSAIETYRRRERISPFEIRRNQHKPTRLHQQKLDGSAILDASQLKEKEAVFQFLRPGLDESALEVLRQMNQKEEKVEFLPGEDMSANVRPGGSKFSGTTVPEKFIAADGKVWTSRRVGQGRSAQPINIIGSDGLARYPPIHLTKDQARKIFGPPRVDTSEGRWKLGGKRASVPKGIPTQPEASPEEKSEKWIESHPRPYFDDFSMNPFSDETMPSLSGGDLSRESLEKVIQESEAAQQRMAAQSHVTVQSDVLTQPVSVAQQNMGEASAFPVADREKLKSQDIGNHPGLLKQLQDVQDTCKSLPGEKDFSKTPYEDLPWVTVFENPYSDAARAKREQMKKAPKEPEPKPRFHLSLECVKMIREEEEDVRGNQHRWVKRFMKIHSEATAKEIEADLFYILACLESEKDYKEMHKPVPMEEIEKTPNEMYFGPQLLSDYEN